MANSSPQQQRKDINVLHAELGHPSEVITQAKVQECNFISQVCLSLVKIVLWEKAKNSGIIKKDIEYSKILGDEHWSWGTVLTLHGVIF